MKQRNVTVTWCAFGNPASATITADIGCDVPDRIICEAVFHDTNTYSGALWRKLETVLPVERTHTALSVGDTVTVDGRTYVCASAGWRTLPPSPTHDMATV